MKTQQYLKKCNLLALLASSALIFNTANASLSITTDYGIQGKAFINTRDIDDSSTGNQTTSVLRAGSPNGYSVAGTYLKPGNPFYRRTFFGYVDALGIIDSSHFTLQNLSEMSYTPQAKFILLNAIGDPFVLGEGVVSGEDSTLYNTIFIAKSNESTELVRRLNNVTSKDLQAVQTELNARTFIAYTSFDNENLGQIIIQEYDLENLTPLTTFPQINNMQAGFSDPESQRLALMDIDLHSRTISAVYNYVFYNDYNSYGLSANKIAITRYTANMEIDTTYGTDGVKQLQLDEGALLLKITDLSINQLGNVFLNNEEEENSISIAANIIKNNIYTIYVAKTNSANDILFSNAGTTIYEDLNVNESTGFSEMAVSGFVTSTNNLSGQVWPYMWNDQPKITFNQGKPTAGNVQYYNCTPLGLNPYIRNYVLVGTQYSVIPEFSVNINFQIFLSNHDDYRISTTYFPQIKLYGLKNNGDLDTSFNGGSISLLHKAGVALRAKKALYNVKFENNLNTYTLYARDSLTVGDLVYWADQTTGRIFTLYTLPIGNVFDLYENNGYYSSMLIDNKSMNYRLYYSVYDQNGTPLKLGHFIRDTNSATYSIQSVNVQGNKVCILGNADDQSSLISIDLDMNEENPTSIRYTGPSDFTLGQDSLNSNYAYNNPPVQQIINLSDYLGGGDAYAALEYLLSSDKSGQNGTLALDESRTNILYTPAQYFIGVDTILFYVMNTAVTPNDSSSSYEIKVEVNGRPLTGDGFTYSAVIPFALTYDYLETDAANCIDPFAMGTGGPLNVTASFGTVRFNEETRKIEYKLPDNFFGSKVVEFTVTDINASELFFKQIAKITTTLPQDLVELNSADMLTSVNLNNCLKVQTTDNLLIVGPESETHQLLLSSIESSQDITISGNICIATKVEANQIFVGQNGTLSLTNALNIGQTPLLLNTNGAQFNVSKNQNLSNTDLFIGGLPS